MKQNVINQILAKSLPLFFIISLLIVLEAGIMPMQTVYADTPTPVVDQSFTSPSDVDTAINECCRYIAQTFTAGMTGDLAAVSVDVLSTPHFDLHIAIHAVTNGLPNSSILGEKTLYATTDNPVVSAPLSLVINFSDPIYIIAGHQYAIVVDNPGSGSPGTSGGTWSGATGDLYKAGAAYDTNDESFSSWTPVGIPDTDLHFQTYVIVGVLISDLAIKLVSAPKHAKACEVFEETYRIKNLGPDPAENVIVNVGVGDQFDVISVQGVPGSQSSGQRLSPGQSQLVTAVVKVVGFVPGESREGSVGARVSSDVYPDITIDPNLNNNELSTTVKLISKPVILCEQQPIEINIDIKPGSDTNSINLKSKDTLPVAILSTQDFDAASQVDKTSLTFGKTGDEVSLASCNKKTKDINDDGLKDLVCQFNIPLTGFHIGDTAGILKGKTVNGDGLTGQDSIKIKK